MMSIKDTGILISIKNISEKSQICRVFTREHGIIIGISRTSSNVKHSIYSGAIVNINYTKSSENQIGTLKMESASSYGAAVLSDMKDATLINSMLHMLDLSITENTKQDSLWDFTIKFFQSLRNEKCIIRKVKGYLNAEIEISRSNGAIYDQWFAKEELIIPEKIAASNTRAIAEMGIEVFSIRLALYENLKLLANNVLKNNRIPESRKLLTKLF